MAETSSMDSLPVLNERIARLERRSTASSSSWLVPVLIVIAVLLLFYIWYRYASSCHDQSNDNSNMNNRNGVVIVSNMSNGGQAPSGQVMDLTGDQLVALWTKQPVVVAFMADGCGWCQKLKPEYHQAAKKSKVNLYTMYAQRDGVMPILKQFNIRGFPTVYKLYNGQIVSEYKGNRTADDIAAWASSA